MLDILPALKRREVRSLWGLAWWNTPIIPALGMLKQQKHHKFKISPGYIGIWRPACTIKWYPVSNNKNKPQKPLIYLFSSSGEGAQSFLHVRQMQRTELSPHLHVHYVGFDTCNDMCKNVCYYSVTQDSLTVLIKLSSQTPGNLEGFLPELSFPRTSYS